MIKMFYCTTEEDLIKILGVKDRDKIWKLGISLDDWDYALVAEGNIKKKLITDWYLESLLQGSFENNWKKVKTPKGIFTVGMAYHS